MCWKQVKRLKFSCLFIILQTIFIFFSISLLFWWIVNNNCIFDNLFMHRINSFILHYWFNALIRWTIFKFDFIIEKANPNDTRSHLLISLLKSYNWIFLTTKTAFLNVKKPNLSLYLNRLSILIPILIILPSISFELTNYRQLLYQDAHFL